MALKAQQTHPYMANKVCISDFEIKSTMSFFFDTNIWMYLYCPLGNYKRKEQEITSNFLASLLRTKCEIAITSLSLSEFANAYIKLDYNLWKKEMKTPEAIYKKDYLPTDRCQKTQSLIEEGINQIMALTVRYPDDFNSVDISEILQNFKIADFNDSYYLTLARQRDWIILTDDQDFYKVKTSVTLISVTN